MRLTPEQIGRFERDGYLFFPSLFSSAEMQVLSAEVPRLFAQRRPENMRRTARRCAPISPRTCIAARSPGSRGIRAWSSRS